MFFGVLRPNELFNFILSALCNFSLYRELSSKNGSRSYCTTAMECKVTTDRLYKDNWALFLLLSFCLDPSFQSKRKNCFCNQQNISVPSLISTISLYIYETCFNVENLYNVSNPSSKSFCALSLYQTCLVCCKV